MFSSTLARISHRATATSSSPALAAQRTASQCLASTSQRRPGHQRRHSSSKPSCPPNSSSKPSPAAKAAEATEDGPAPTSEKSAKRTSKVKRSPLEKSMRGKEASNHFAGLPAVPEMHLGEKDFWLSTFFSLHQPLSLTTPVPAPVSNDVFHNIFESKPQHDAWENGNSAQRRPEDVIITLHSTIENLEGGIGGAQEEGVRWEVLQESSSNAEGTKHLDGPPRARSIDELVAQFKPFHAPPPPQPFPAETKPADKKRAARQPKSKSFQTTIVVTESTDPNGQRTYTASQSPLVQLPDPESRPRAPLSHQPFQPFLQRAWRKHQAFLLSQHQRSLERQSSFREPNPLRTIRRAPGLRKEQMRLISVKRQRKLKMKKHKYKKLMKRTRNLRRRLDRG